MLASWMILACSASSLRTIFSEVVGLATAHLHVQDRPTPMVLNVGAKGPTQDGGSLQWRIACGESRVAK
jgi:hypothetical protein